MGRGISLNFFALLVLSFGVTFGPTAQATGPLARSHKPNMRPFLDIVQAPEAGNPKLVVFGETHGVQEYHEFYIHALTALAESNSGFNCLFVESPKESAAAVDAFLNNQISADEVNQVALTSLFGDWGLYDHAPDYDWPGVIKSISTNVILSPQLLNRARRLGVHVVPVDEMVIEDFVNMTYLELARTRGEEAAHAHVEKSGLAQFLSPAPTLYYKDEIINRRNEQMTKNIMSHLQSGECNRGLVIVGAMHAHQFAAGGTRVYTGDREAINTRLKKAGIPALTLDFMLSDYEFGFEGVPANPATLHYRVDTRWKSLAPWSGRADYDGVVIIRE